MRPEVWGKSLWQTMHAVALGYPSEPTEYQKLAYRTFYANLGEVIPCESCAASFRRMMHKRGGLKSLDAALDASQSRATCENKAASPLFDWTVDVHNATNAELGKPSNWTSERTRAAVIRGGAEDGEPPPAPVSSSAQHDVISATWKAMAVGFIFAAIFVTLCRTFLNLFL